MKLSKFDYTIIIAIGFLVAVPAYAFITNQVIAQGDRKEFTKCAVNINNIVTNSTTYLDGSRITFTYNGCPSERIYIDHWDNIPPLTQTNLMTQLTSAGFTGNPNLQ